MKKQMFRDTGAGDTGGGGEGESAYENWLNKADKTDDQLLQERQEFIATKTPEEWAAEAAAAKKDVNIFQREAWNSGVAPPPPDFTPNPLWDELKGVEGFEMPTDLSAENEADLLKKALVDGGLATGETLTPEQIAANKAAEENNVPPIVDPEVQAYLNWKELNPDKSMNDYVESNTPDTSILNLGDKDFMTEFYKKEYGIYDAEKNPDGLTEEQIEAAVSKLEDNAQLPIEVRKLKGDIRKNIEDQKLAKTTETQQTIEARKVEAQRAIESDLSELFAGTEKITELNGVKISKAEVTSLNDAFKKAVLPDQKGEVPIVKMLQSNENLWKFFAVQYQGDSKFKDALFSATDSTKEELIKKLGLTPKITGGRQSDLGNNQNVITPSKWAEPDQSDV